MSGSPTPAGGQDNGRRELIGACLLTALGGGLLLSAAGRTWASAVITEPPLPARRLPVTGGDLGGSFRATAWVALAGVPALVALRGHGRQVVGLVLAVVGLAAIVAFGRAGPAAIRASDPVASRLGTGASVAVSGRTGWPYAYLIGGIVVTVAGCLTLVRSRRWPGLGARYDAPTARRQPAEDAEDAWRVLDRGEDPTLR